MTIAAVFSGFLAASSSHEVPKLSSGAVEATPSEQGCDLGPGSEESNSPGLDAALVRLSIFCRWRRHFDT